MSPHASAEVQTLGSFVPTHEDDISNAGTIPLDQASLDGVVTAQVVDSDPATIDAFVKTAKEAFSRHRRTP